MTVLDMLRSKIRTKMNDLADAIAGGGATDYAEYKHMAGQIHGLALAERDILDLQDSMEEDKNTY